MTSVYLLGSCLLDSIQKLLQVSALEGCCGLRAGQNSHEMVDGSLQIPQLLEGPAQSVMNVFLYEAP